MRTAASLTLFLLFVTTARSELFVASFNGNRIHRYSETNGAAIGTSVSMVLGSLVLVRSARNALGTEVVKTVVATVTRHAPLAVVCLLWAAAVHVFFDQWFLGTSVSLRYDLGRRALAGAIAVGLYFACLLSLLLVKQRVIGVDPEDRALLARTLLIGRTRPREAVPAPLDPAATKAVAPDISHSLPPGGAA